MAVEDYSRYFKIGEGTSACTYGSLNPKNLLIQIKREETARNNSALIQRLGLVDINRKQEQLIYPKNIIKNVPKNLKTEACKLKGTGENPLKMVEIPNGGKDLESLEIPSEDISSFFTGFVNIFEALGSLHKKKIVHLDVKPLNMVGKKESDGKYNLRVIDFGLSLDIYMPNDFSIFYEYDKTGKFLAPVNYRYWSYDLRLLNGKLFNRLCSSNIDKDIENFKKQSDIFSRFYILSFKEDLVKSVAKILSTPKDAKEISVQILLKSDVFALGVSLYEIYRRLTADNKVSNIYSGKVEGATRELLHLVRLMCNPDVFTRLTLEQAKEKYINDVLPAIISAYSSDVKAGLGGGSRRRRKTTRRNNIKYVKAKKTRSSTK
jgi:serine/threonine protein kinase